MKGLSWRVILSGLATLLVVFAGLVWLLQTHVLLAGSAALMVGVAVAGTVRCGELPQAPPRAVDWYWLGAFAAAWLLSTVGLATIDSLSSRGRLEAEVLILSATAMGFALGHLAGLHRARPAPSPDGSPTSGTATPQERGSP